MEDVPQSGVVDDEMLERLLDRSWMLEGDDSKAPAAEAEAAAGPSSSKGSKVRGKSSRSSSDAEVEAGAGPSNASGREVVSAGLPYPPSGVGYEVVQSMDTNVLSNVN